MGNFLRGISVGVGTMMFLLLFVEIHTLIVVGMVVSLMGLVLSLATRD